MELESARTMARELMDEYGLQSWTFSFDRAKRRAGQCRFDRRTITLSRHLTVLHGHDLVRDTVLHEIAHALVGPGEGHGPQWKAAARLIGAQPNRTLDSDAPVPDAPWRGTCPGGHDHRRFRRPTQPVSCRSCCTVFCPAHLISWQRNGQSVDLGDVYRLHLRMSEQRWSGPCRVCGRTRDVAAPSRAS